MEFNGIKNISDLIDLVKQSEYDESPEDLIFDQFLNNAKVERSFVCSI